MKHPLEQTKLNKNLLRVAAEISGKGTKKGEMGLDEIEAIHTNADEQDHTPETTPEPEMAMAEEIELIGNLVLEQLLEIENNIGYELVDENLDYAIDKIIDNLLEG